MCVRRWKWAFAVGLLFTAIHLHAAERAPRETGPFLHGIFTDHMVLQRDQPVAVWGWSRPGSRIEVAIAGESGSATTRADGVWMVHLPPLQAGGPHTLVVRGQQTRTVSDVMVGDVWLCGGQSNMELPIQSVSEPGPELAKPVPSDIRLFTVPRALAVDARNDVPMGTSWQRGDARSLADFSAVCYFFGRELRPLARVPIGLVHASWGGTIGQAWTSHDALARLGGYEGGLASVDAYSHDPVGGARKYLQEMNGWFEANDAGSSAPGWESPALDSSGWKTLVLPQEWNRGDLPNFRGIVWLRRTVQLSPDWVRSHAILSLANVDDRDSITTWVNGIRLQDRDRFATARRFQVPSGALHAGANVIAIRALDVGGGSAGIYGSGQDLYLQGDDVRHTENLAGPWAYNVSLSLQPGGAMPPVDASGAKSLPTVLYNGMIAPLTNFRFKGVVWYQGESDRGSAREYYRLLPTLIADWRARFGSQLPFVVVQIASFLQQKALPVESSWADIREAQRLTVNSTAATGLVSTIDVGDGNSLHPLNKQAVGYRAALVARRIAYGENLTTSGPVPRASRREGDSIYVSYTADPGPMWVLGGDRVKGFALCNRMSTCVWAEGALVADQVRLEVPPGFEPTEIRYGWADNPEINLYGAGGLPAVPFRINIGAALTPGR